jgi:hypothetical protein
MQHSSRSITDQSLTKQHAFLQQQQQYPRYVLDSETTAALEHMQLRSLIAALPGIMW